MIHSAVISPTVISPTLFEMKALMTTDGLEAHRKKISNPHYEDKMVHIFQTTAVIF